MTENAKKEEIYGLVINHRSFYIRNNECGWFFYAPDNSTLNHETVIREVMKDETQREHDKESKKIDVYLVFPSNDSRGFRVEPVKEGNQLDFIAGKTPTQITREMLFFKGKKINEENSQWLPSYPFDIMNRYYVIRDRCRKGETLAHYIADLTELYSDDRDTKTKKENIPYHLFDNEVLSLKGLSGCPVALVMANNNAFPLEMITEENINIDSEVLPFLLLDNKKRKYEFNEEFDNKDAYNRDIETDKIILTKERLKSLRIGNNFLAINAASKNRIPEEYLYEPDILSLRVGGKWEDEGADEKEKDKYFTVLEILVEEVSDYIQNFPLESIIPELLSIKVNVRNSKTKTLERVPFRDALAREGKFPRDEAEAMNWLVSGPEDDDQVRAAELFYRVEYPPELYRDVIRMVRESCRRQSEKAAVEPGFVERYIL